MIRLRNWKFHAPGLLFLVLSACSSAPPPSPVTMGKISPDDRYVLKSLEKNSEQIVRSVRNLERASLRNIHLSHLPPPTGGAAYLISLGFDGPLDEAVRDVAAMIRYSVHFSGRKPVIPIIVSVHEKRRPAQAVLEDMGLQVGRSVGIHLDEISNRIDVTYGNSVPEAR